MRVGFGLFLAIWAAASAALAAPAAPQIPATAPPNGPCVYKPLPTPVYFEWNRSELTPTNAQLLAMVAARTAAEKCSVAKIEVAGHLDMSEEADPGLALDVRRADAVAQALVAAGFSEATVQKVAKGKSSPAKPTAEGVREPLNRRVVVTITYNAALTEMQALDKKKADQDAAGAAVVEKLLDPARCATPAPKGYACAVLAYEDKRLGDGATPKSEMLAPVARLVTGVSRENGEVKVTVLHPTTHCPSAVRPGSLLEFILDYRAAPGQSIEFPMRLYGLMGRGENDALAADNPLRIEAGLFKAGACLLPQRAPASPPPAPKSLISESWGEPAQKVLAEFGLIGDFSDTCATPTGGPGHFVFSNLGDGAVLSRSAVDVPEVRTLGSLQTVYVRGKRSGSNEVTLRGTIGPLNIEVETKISKGPKGYRIWSMKSIEGKMKVIIDGKFDGHDYIHPWMAKCG